MFQRKILSHLAIAVLTLSVTSAYLNYDKDIISSKTAGALIDSINKLEDVTNSLNKSVMILNNRNNDNTDKSTIFNSSQADIDSSLELVADNSALTLENIKHTVDALLEEKLSASYQNSNSTKAIEKPAQPTNEQITAFNDINDIISNQRDSLSFNGVTTLMSNKNITLSQKREIMDRTMQMLNRGEINKEIFLGD